MVRISIRDVVFRILAIKRDGHWTARAEHDESARPFGIECSGPTETSAVDRLTRWLEWRSAHGAALDALQQAERAYHRTIANGAFADRTEGPIAVERRQESLGVVDAARARLDDIRAQQPEQVSEREK